MNRIYEGFAIEPMMAISNTVVATSVRKVKWGDDAKMGFYCRIGGAAPTGTAMSCTAVNKVLFTLTEATASTHAGSAIANATMTLGVATAYEPISANALIVTLTSVVGTAVSFTINGFSYHATDPGAGTSGEGVASALAHAINGGGTQEKLPHYMAIGNFTDTGIVAIFPDDGLGTGLTCTAANATDFKVRAAGFTGMIELNAYSLSTNRPKWIGVNISSNAGASCMKTVDAIRYPSYSPGFGGLTTYI